MTETIQLQAIRLELGDDFEDYYARTQSYVKGLIGKSWWHNKKQLLDCEGPLSKMVEHCLVYVVEENDRIKGYKAYTAYLTGEYGSSLSRNKNVVSMQDVDYRMPTTVPSSSGTQTPVEANVQNMIPEWMTKEQADFLVMHSKMGMREAAEMAGMSHEDGWRLYRNMREKARYRRAKRNG